MGSTAHCKGRAPSSRQIVAPHAETLAWINLRHLHHSGHLIHAAGARHTLAPGLYKTV